MELDKIKALRKNLIFLAMIELIGGLFMIIYHTDTLDIIAITLGVVAAAYGIVSFFVWLVKKEKSNTVSVIVTLVLGIVVAAFLIFFRDEEHIKMILTLILGIVAAVLAIMKLPHVFALKKAGYKKWAFVLIPIAITVALGIIIGLKPYGDNPIVTSVLLGVSLIGDCATDIFLFAGASETEKAFKNSTEIVETDKGK